MSRELRAAFALRVYETFEDLAYPAAHDIFSARMYAELIDMHLAFEDHEWDTVVIEKVIEFRDYLDYFSIEGLAYFLPTYLFTLLRFPDESDTLYLSLLDTLAAMENRDTMVVVRYILNAPCKQVILEFLMNYHKLFSEDAYALIESEIDILHAAILFWQT